MRRAVRRIDPRRATLLLIAAALALGTVPFDRLVAKESGPPAPSGLSATATGTSLTLSWDVAALWDPVGNVAVHYEVKLGADGETTTVSSGTSYTFTGLAANTSYTLYVRTNYADSPKFQGTSGYIGSSWSSISATTLTAGPSGLSATATSTSLTLSWTVATGATGYEVKLGASGAATTVPSGTSHTFSNLTTNTSYTLYVRAKDSGGNSGWSSISATTLTAGPSGLSATAFDTVLTLFWDAVAGATSYEVKLGVSGAATTVSSGTGHTFSSLTANTSYTLYVRAKNSGGVSDWSSITKSTRGPITSPLDITAPTDGDGSSLIERAGGAIDLTTPAAPSGLSATATSTSLTLNWSSGSPGMTGTTVYEVKRGADGAAATPSGLSHTFSGLTAGTEYTLYVRSRLGSGASEVSDWVSLDAATAPAAPSGLSAAATSASLTLSWTAVSGATSYEVKRGASGVATTVSSGTSHTFSGLSAGTNYTLHARAKNSGGASDWSSLTAITVPATPDAARLRSVAHSGDLYLHWDAVTGAASYEVKTGPGGAVTTASSNASHRFSGVWATGREHTLYVRARNSGGASDWAWITYSGSNPPLALTGLSATATSASLTLSWTSAPSNKTTYEVKLGASGTVATVAATGHTFTTYGTGDKVASELSHTFTGWTGGTEYTLYVRAKNSGGTSPWASVSATTLLAAPSGLSATTTLSSLTLSWDSVPGATSYEVKQGASGAATAIVSGTSHTFTGLTANTSYTLYVRAKNSGGTSPWASASATTKLATPTGLRTNGYDGGGLHFHLDAVAGATSYEVKLGASGAVTTAHGPHLSSPNHQAEQGASGYGRYGVPLNIPGYFPLLTPETLYERAKMHTLYVRARNSEGTSDWNTVTGRFCGYYGSNYSLPLDEVDGLWDRGRHHYYHSTLAAAAPPQTPAPWPPPPAPGGCLRVTAESPTSLTLTWFYRNPNVLPLPASPKSFEVKLGESGAVTSVLPGAMSGATRSHLNVAWTGSHTFTGLTLGTEYTLFVRMKAQGGGSPSPWFSITGTTWFDGVTAMPVAPSGLSATTTSSSATLSWGSVAGATSYEVKLNAYGKATTVSSGTSHTFSRLVGGTQHTLYVRAKNSGGWSDWSSISATTAAGTLATPTGLSVAVNNSGGGGADSVTLSWSSVSGATSYEVTTLLVAGMPITVSGTSHTFVARVRGRTYTLYVRAKNSSETSPWSSITGTIPSR